MPEPQNVAMIGLGIMGGAIARNLAGAGFALAGYDVDAGKMAALAKDGVRQANSAAGAVGGAAIALTSLPSVAALEATVAELAANPAPGLVVVEISTLPIAAKEAARDRLAAAGMILLDCPLSGTGAQAAVKDLAVYASGEEAAFGRCRELFAGFARVTHYLGAFGNGSRMKFVANLLVSVHNVAAAEAIVLGTKAGLDPARILEVIASGAANSRIFELRGPMMAAGEYTPPTATMHVLQKDSAIIAEFARSLGVATPTLDAAAPLYDEAEHAGYAEEDVAAVHAVLARRAGL
ncbi:MAG TPA: NAD(P)-dependent oxidoreductase [Stellaceae bacterium]|jgi:3-hydroxyisobutyrate dehydrogenase-like beta-hydroxyacid dehydrogenase|nr:NAD(P)-dependent oxidoreductase [Stellaceae bacterium]